MNYYKLKDLKEGYTYRIDESIERDGKYGRQITLFLLDENGKRMGVNHNTAIARWIDENGHIQASDTNIYYLHVGAVIVNEKDPKYNRVDVRIEKAEIPF